VLDSSHILGAAGVRDTFTLLRGGLRKLLRALGYSPTRQGDLTPRVAAYLDPAAPAKPDIDWADAAVRLAALRELVADVREGLALVAPATDQPAVCEAAALLAKIVADDIEEGPPPGPNRRGRPARTQLAEAPGVAVAPKTRASYRGVFFMALSGTGVEKETSARSASSYEKSGS